MRSCVFKIIYDFLALTLLKPLKLGLFGMKHGTQHYLVHIIVLKWLELKTIVICLILTSKLHFNYFLNFFCTYLFKDFKTMFISHETRHTTRFGIYYFVEMVRFETNSHLLEITCEVVLLMF